MVTAINTTPTGVSGRTSQHLSQTGNANPGDKDGEPAHITLLKRLDEGRDKRNKKRQELRDAGEAASEDEEDLITAYLASDDGAAQGNGGMVEKEKGLGQEGNTDSEELEEHGGGFEPATVLLFSDEDALNVTLQENTAVFPEYLIILAKCKISPPLTLFRPDILKGIRLNTNVKMKKIATGATTSVRVLDTDAYPAETKLDSSTWQSTYNTFLAFIQKVSGPGIHAGFVRHYDRLISDPQFERWFPAFREFDREIRSEFFVRPMVIKPSGADYRAKLQSAKDDFILTRQDSPAAHALPRNFQQGNPTSHSQQGGSHPYSQVARSSFRPQICLRCGSADGHKAQACTAAQSNRHGRSLIIKAGSSGLFRITDNKAVCLNYNLRGCPITSANHALHLCSLCGDPHHGASNCTRN